MANPASIATTIPTSDRNGTRFPVDSRTMDPVELALGERVPEYTPDVLDVEPGQPIHFAWTGSEDPAVIEATDANGNPFPLFDAVETAYPVAAWKGTTYEVVSSADGVYYVKRRGASVRATINVRKAK